MASKVRSRQIAETPSERLERVFKQAVERHRRADERRAKRNGKRKQVTISQRSSG